METKFNFKSQVCTDRFQSERLLALGLKKETADMCSRLAVESNGITRTEVEDIFSFTPDDWDNAREVTPRWSLHRLMSLVFDSSARVELFKEDDVYEFLICNIAWRIKEGYFNKEYLEE